MTAVLSITEIQIIYIAFVCQSFLSALASDATALSQEDKVKVPQKRQASEAADEGKHKRAKEALLPVRHTCAHS